MADLYRVKEVLNYGGFFAGDTVTLIAQPLGGGDERDFTIDDHAFRNVTDRYKIAAGMLLALETEGEKVLAATLVGAATREALRDAIDSEREKSDVSHKPYRVFAYRCPACAAWVRGEPDEPSTGHYQCRLCTTALG